MKFIVTKASDINYFEIKEVSTLEELLAFREETGEDVIIGENWYYRNPISNAILSLCADYNLSPEKVEEICACSYELQIYDDYIE